MNRTAGRSPASHGMRNASLCLRAAPLILAGVSFTAAAATETEQAGSRDSQPDIEEIVVTATKRSEKLQDVPVAVSVIGAADIETRGLTRYQDYLNGVPGVYFEDSGPGRTQVRMRGVVADDLPGSATVATYFGETVTSVLSTPNLRMVDIDRVEVMRGPQGTLFGANALTGVIRVVPSAPRLDRFEASVGTRGFATAHSDDISYHGEAMVNIPLLQDRLAVRMVAYQDRIAGYIDSVVPAREPLDYSYLVDVLTGQEIGTTPQGTLVTPGNPAFSRKDINSEDTWGARVGVSLQASEQLRFDLSYVSQRVDFNSEPQVQPFAGRYVQQRPMDRFDPGKLGEDADIGSLVINYDWQSVSLVSASSYMRTERTRVIDESFFAQGALGAPIAWSLREPSTGELFSQELRLRSSGTSPLQWLVGAFYLEQSVDSVQFVPDFSCPTCLTRLFGQDFDFALRPVPGGDPRVLDQKQRSAFAEVSYAFSPRWVLGVGGRYLEDEIETRAPAYEGFLANGVLPAEGPYGGTNYVFNPSAYLRYKPTADMTLYVQAARGFRSGTANQTLSFTGECADEAASIGLERVSDPDTLRSYEFGVKSQLAAGRVDVSAAVYKQEWDGVQLGTSLECGYNGTINAGDVDGEGVELEVGARLADAWRLNLSTSYTRNEFDTVVAATGFARGERVPNAPEKNASLGLQYDFDVNAAWTGFARADWMYVGDARYKFGQGEDALAVLQPAYNTANLRVGLARGPLAVELFGRNVTDRRAVVYTGDPELGDYQYLLRPREIGVEVRYEF